MSDPYYYQYAFARPDCYVQEIGPGIDAPTRWNCSAKARRPP